MSGQIEIEQSSLDRQPSFYPLQAPGAYYRLGYGGNRELRRASAHTWRRREGPPRRFPGFYYDVDRVFLVDNDGLVHVIERPEQQPPAGSSPALDVEHVPRFVPVDGSGFVPVFDAVLVPEALLVEATPVPQSEAPTPTPLPRREVPTPVPRREVPTPVPRRGRLKKTLASARRFFSKKTRTRRPASAYPSHVEEDSPTEPDERSEESTDPVRPGASRVEPDPEDPDYEISRDAPVDNSPAGRLRRLLRRWVRLGFELGERRDVVEAEVQVIQRRIDNMEANPGLDVENFNVVEESPRIGADGSSRVPLEDVGDSSEVPFLLAQDAVVALVGRSDESPMIAQDSSVALDEIYASQFLAVPTNKVGKPDPYAPESWETKPTWGRPTVKSDKDDDDDALSSVSGNSRAGSGESPSGQAPSRSSLEESLRAAREENQRLRDELQSSIDERERMSQTHQQDLRAAREENQRLRDELQTSIAERERMSQAHQEELHIAETDYRQSLAEKVDALQEKDRELEAALQEKDRELEAVLQENDRVLEGALQEKDRELQTALQEKDRVLEAALQGKDRELQTALKEKDRVLEGASAVLVSLRDELNKADAEYAASISRKDGELQEMKRELAVTKLEQRRLEEKHGEFEQKLEAMAGQIEALAGQKRHVIEESQQCRNASSEDKGQKRRRIHDVCACGSDGDSRPSKECRYPINVDCDLEDSVLYTSDCDCSESSVSFYDDSTADDRETVRCPSWSRLSQAWTPKDVDVVKDAFRRLRKVFHRISMKCDVNSGTLPDWTYHWKYPWAEGSSICHTFLFSKGAPPNTMAEVTAGVLRGLIKRASKSAASSSRRFSASTGALFRVKEVTSLRTCMLITTETDLDSPVSMMFGENVTEASEIGESQAKGCKVEMLIALVDASPDSCLAASSRVDPKMQRLIVCAKGVIGEAGEHGWRGGLDVVLKSIRTILNSSFPFDAHEIVCPACLNERHTRDSQSSTWSFEDVSRCGSSTVCCQRGHNVERTLICGTPPQSLFTRLALSKGLLSSSFRKNSPIRDRGVVQVFVQDSEGAIREVGSGFVFNRKLGGVVTSGHILWKDEEFVYFPPDGQPILKPNIKLLISIPCENSEDQVRYYEAELASSDYQNVDACVLRVVGSTKFSSSVQDLKLAGKFHLQEYVRLCGFNQGGEGRYRPSTFLDSSLDVVPGVISKHCNYVQSAADIMMETRLVEPNGFFPDEEIAISGLSRAIKGHSGGPCINERGDVVGILSRVDGACPTRWYITPISRIRSLIEKL